MWITDKILAILNINIAAAAAQRDEVSALRAANSILERELVSVKIMSDFLRMTVNQLNAERSVLISKAYPGLHLPAPEIARVANKVQNGFDLNALFEDMGDDSTTPIS